MKNILIHGLGQNSKDWDTIKNELETREISPIVPEGSYRNKRKPEAYLLLFCESTVSKTRHWQKVVELPTRK